MQASPNTPRPSPEKFTLKDAAMGMGCLVIVGLFVLYVITGVNRFFNPPRPVNLKEPVRAVQNKEEKAIRQEWEQYALSAAWQGDQGADFPAKKIGPEIRPGVSLFTFCNRTDRNLRFFFDGAEIFKLEVANGASVSMELKSGLYDHLIIAPGGQGSDVIIAPFYQRVEIRGSYHDLFALDGNAEPCPGQHGAIRLVP